MCQKLYEAGIKILGMGYYKNENARSGDYNPGHEDAVAEVLTEVGFTDVTEEDYGLKRGLLKEWWENGFDGTLDEQLANMPNGSFILQPGGTQSFPDILVKDFNGRMVALECKSGKGTHPMWNDSTPKFNAVYIMSSGKVDETTVFMGNDAITKKQLELIEEAVAEMVATAKKYNVLIANEDFCESGFTVNCRKQFFQQGGALKTNFFTHKYREMREKNVLEFLAI
jgi:hypothetical protein